MTSVLPVCYTSADAGVFYWVWAAAVGLQVSACRVVAGAGVGVFTAVVGTACLAAAADGVLTGC